MSLQEGSGQLSGGGGKRSKVGWHSRGSSHAKGTFTKEAANGGNWTISAREEGGEGGRKKGKEIVGSRRIVTVCISGGLCWGSRRKGVVPKTLLGII